MPMKAVVLAGIGKVEVREVPMPRPVRDDEVLVRMGAVGICGSDIHYYLDGRIGDQVVVHPAVIGHEGAGVIESLGPAAGGLKPGDRVAIEPAVVCGRCDQCLDCRPNTCRELFSSGPPASFRAAVRIHRHARAELPAAPRKHERRGRCACRAAVDRPPQLQDPGRCRAAEKTGILGSGTIGLAVLLAARAARAGPVLYDGQNRRTASRRPAGPAHPGPGTRTGTMSSPRSPLASLGFSTPFSSARATRPRSTRRSTCWRPAAGSSSSAFRPRRACLSISTSSGGRRSLSSTSAASAIAFPRRSTSSPAAPPIPGSC